MYKCSGKIQQRAQQCEFRMQFQALLRTITCVWRILYGIFSALVSSRSSICAKIQTEDTKFPVQKSIVYRRTGPIVETYTKQHGNQILDLGYDHTLQNM